MRDAGLTFRPAGSFELPVVVGILNDAAQWLRDRGIEQWPAPYDADGWRLARLQRSLACGETWLVFCGYDAGATFSLSTVDEDFTAGWPDEDGLHINQFAVQRAWSGHDIGGRILDWTGQYARRAGFQWLRLNCHRNNALLHRYYLRKGFDFVGTVEHPTRMSGSLFQRRTVESIEGAAVVDLRNAPSA